MTVGFTPLTYPKPQTLGEHVFTKKLVATQVNSVYDKTIDFTLLNSYFMENKDSTEYLVILNFLYGDKAMISLGNEAKGIAGEFAGFEYAKWLAENDPKRGIKHDTYQKSK